MAYMWIKVLRCGLRGLVCVVKRLMCGVRGLYMG